jgi:hypothetical protein
LGFNFEQFGPVWPLNKPLQGAAVKPKGLFILLPFHTVPLLLNEGSVSKASAPPLFLEDENIFSKIGLRGSNSTAIPPTM